MLFSKWGYSHLIIGITTGIMTACGTAPNLGGAKKSDSPQSPNETQIGPETPENSTGASGKVGLVFGTASFALADSTATANGTSTASSTNTSTSSGTATAASTSSTSISATSSATSTATSTMTSTSTTLKISDSLTLSMARFNIASIKVRAKKEPTPDEDEVDKKEGSEENEDVQKLESAANNASLALLEGSSNQSGQGTKEVGKSSSTSSSTGTSTGTSMGTGKTAETATSTEPSKAGPMPPMPPKEGDGPLKQKQKDSQDRIAKKKDEFKEHESDRREKSNNRDKTTKFKGPYVYDALKGALESALPETDLVDGSYKRIEFKLARNFDLAATDPLLGNVFFIKGIFTASDGKTYNLEIENHVAMNFRLRGDGSFDVTANIGNRLAIAFDITKWFVGIDLSTAKVDDSGTIFINKNSNQPLLRQIKKNIKKNTKFGKDKDSDGKLSAAEILGQGEETPDED